MKRVVIASKNPVKINAVKNAFGRMFPGTGFEFEGISVPLGVGDQPMGNIEIRTGAENRADNAKKAARNADYWVGIEGGIEKTSNNMESFAWVVIKSNGISGRARTGTFLLPNKIAELIDAGKELGEADDIVFGLTNSKRENGTVGTLTGNIIDRTKYYSEAVVLSLIPFKNSEIY